MSDWMEREKWRHLSVHAFTSLLRLPLPQIRQNPTQKMSHRSITTRSDQFPMRGIRAYGARPRQQRHARIGNDARGRGRRGRRRQRGCRGWERWRGLRQKRRLDDAHLSSRLDELGWTVRALRSSLDVRLVAHGEVDRVQTTRTRPIHASKVPQDVLVRHYLHHDLTKHAVLEVDDHQNGRRIPSALHQMAIEVELQLRFRA